MRLLWKLLRCHLSMAQTVGFTLAGLVGMAIVLTALQAYRDVLPVFDRPDSFMRGDYLVLSKQVGALQAIGLGSSDFTAEELADLRAQPFVREAGAFTPADYRIKGTVGMGGVELSTYLFFESVPDRFLDVGAENWDYKAGDRDIPIIIPRNYLNLYNYGFARSQGLPQISEGIFRRVSLGIEIAGNGHREQFRGRIVGLSNRLNTILVPAAFIRWSNGRFGSGAAKQPARIIVETDRPVDAAVTDYLARKGYEAEGDRRDDGRAEDLTQEVFLRALQNRSLINSFTERQCKAWLFTTARNLYCDQLRRAAKEEQLLSAFFPEEDSAEPDSALDTVEAASLLALLTPEERRLFTLRYTAGYNASEIGQLLCLPPGTVRSRLAQIRHRLKTELTEE